MSKKCLTHGEGHCFLIKKKLSGIKKAVQNTKYGKSFPEETDVLLNKNVKSVYYNNQSNKLTAKHTKLSRTHSTLKLIFLKRRPMYKRKNENHAEYFF